MQKSKIEWCDSTWNPVTGCKHGCKYCYARRIAERFGGGDNPVPGRGLLQPLSFTRKNGQTVDAAFPFGFEPTLHRYRLEEPQCVKKPQNIFVCSMADLFGQWVPLRWIIEVLDACEAAPQHQYLFLTKNQSRYLELDKLALLPYGKNFWYGSTVTGIDMGAIYQREEEVNTFWSMEPLLGPVDMEKAEGLPQWIILGAMTGPGAKKYLPADHSVREIVTACEWYGIPVFMKDSLLPVWGDGLLRQFPWEDEP